jgi:HlyD family secretion protein
VVPQTVSQAGNTLFTIANMDDLIFKGQVNEIDVGKIREGMSASITLGAFPDQAITGILTKVALQSVQAGQNNADSAASTSSSASSNATSPFNVGFEVKIAKLQLPKMMKLRAGYSANAQITIQKATNALLLPERVIDFEGDKTFVWMSDKFSDKPQKRAIKIGISDGVNVAIVSGLKAGDRVLDNTTVSAAAADSTASAS